MKWFALLFVVANVGDCARILNIAYLPSYSHYILGHTFTEELTRIGHNVTYVHLNEKPFEKVQYRAIQLQGFHALMGKYASEQSPLGLMNMSPFTMTTFMYGLAKMSSRFVLSHEKFQPLYEEEYDLVILEEFMSDALKGLCHHYNAVCVGFSSLSANYMANYAVGNKGHASYIPHIFLPYNSNMNFVQRAHNLLYYTFNELYTNLVHFPSQEKILHEFFPTAPSIHEVIRSTSIILLNSHPSITQPIPLPPSMIEIGGFHVTPAKELPGDLQKYLDEAKDGAVFFSLGSNVKSTLLSESTRSGILKAFSKFKVRVLWKFEDESLIGIPDNVLIRKWMPQQEILAHPNLKAFITHGGLLSTTEACYHGVPLIGIPLFADQGMNIEESVSKGVGLLINFDDLGYDTIYESLNKILTDNSFKENAIKRSASLHDRPMKPLDTAMYWIEYVLKHKGADHLKIGALDLPWYQYLLLDVIAVAIIILILPLVVLIMIIRRCRNSSQTKYNNKGKKMN